MTLLLSRLSLFISPEPTDECLQVNNYNESVDYEVYTDEEADLMFQYYIDDYYGRYDDTKGMNYKEYNTQEHNTRTKADMISPSGQEIQLTCDGIDYFIYYIGIDYPKN